jgi:hypothetical protein
MDDGCSAVAEIPHREDRRGILSEVASREFAREVLGVPVPRVLAWNTDGEGRSGVYGYGRGEGCYAA